MIKVLIVDDSPTIRELMTYILNSDNNIRVIGTANSGENAIKFIERNKPDIITMDIRMPGMDGFETTRRIMETNPIPIVIVTGSLNSRDIDKTFQTMEAGAVSILEKPIGITQYDFPKVSQNIIDTVKLMSEVKVIRRKAAYKKVKQSITSYDKLDSALPEIKIAAVGVSTGGPPYFRLYFPNFHLILKFLYLLYST